MSTRGLLLATLFCGVVSSSAWASEAPASGKPASAKAAAGDTRTLPGGAVVTFSKDAKYELLRPIMLQLLAAGSEKTPVQVIKLTAGRVSVTLPESKKPKTAVLIQAPRKVGAIAMGGQSVVIAAADRVTVAAVRGEMLAALGNDWKALAGGLVRSFGAGVVAEQPILSAPKLNVASNMLLALDGDATAKVRAAPAQNVAYRQLSLFRVEGNKRMKLSDADWRSEEQALPRLGPGRYEVLARAVDRFGVESINSEPLTLRVIGAQLPEGARLVGDSILLRRTGRVKLIGADGLEASYGRANVFIPVPKDVGLARGENTLLRLREPGTKAELGIKLEPRTLKADVEIGPKSARWPGEVLQVTVKLFDHQGKPSKDELKHEPQVFVNVAHVSPTWTHSGNTYTAKVAPTAGTGPWVVRVEVSDDFGDPVGRDFIELGSAKTASTN